MSWLASLAGLTPEFGLFAAGLFAFNPHGVDMAVLWVSGRTGLLLTLFSLGAAIAFLKRRPCLSAGLSFCALLSKEEAVALPVVFFLWAFFEALGEDRPRRAMRAAFQRTQWMWLAGLIYAALHLHSDAIWPTNAPVSRPCPALWCHQLAAKPIVPTHDLANSV